MEMMYQKTLDDLTYFAAASTASFKRLFLQRASQRKGLHQKAPRNQNFDQMEKFSYWSDFKLEEDENCDVQLFEIYKLLQKFLLFKIFISLSAVVSKKSGALTKSFSKFGEEKQAGTKHVKWKIEFSNLTSEDE